MWVVGKISRCLTSPDARRRRSVERGLYRQHPPWVDLHACYSAIHRCHYTLWGIKNCTLLTGTITLQNYAILWRFLAYRCTREYAIACLFDSPCKIENWEPAYQICYCFAYLLADNNIKCETVAATRDRRLHYSSPDPVASNIPHLNTVDYRICGVLQERVYRKSIKNWTLMNWSGFWFKRRLASSKVSLIGQLTNGEFTLMHVSKLKESILKICYDVLFHNCHLLWNLHSVIFCFTTFSQSWLLKF